MKTTFYLFGALLSAFFFVVPLQSQILQWERFPIADSAYDATVIGLTKTRFGLITNARNEQVLFSHDKGRSWQKAKWKGLGDTAIFPGMQFSRALEFHESPTKLFARTSYLCFSSDSGKTWEAMRGSLYNNNPTTNFLVIGKLIILDTTLFTLDNGDIYRSVDDGKTWKHIDFFVNAADTSSGFGGFLIDNIEVEDGTLMLFFTRGLTGYVSRLISIDNGATWRFDDGIPLPAKSGETTLTRLQDSLFLAKQRVVQNGVFFYYWLSRDSGKTWNTFSLLGSKDNIINHISIGSTLFFATTQGIFTTRDRGVTWQKESGVGVLPDARFSYLTLDGNTLYAGVEGKGVYRADVSTITSVESTYNQGFTIYPIAPNPSTDYADLAFTLPHTAQAAVTLYSTLSIEVWCSESSTFSAGEQHIRIDTRHLPTGVYAYRLVVNGVSSVGRIVVVR